MDLELLLYSIKIGIAMILNSSIETAEDITLIAIQVELEPSGVLYVCLGAPLRTSCSVSSLTINDETLLEWIITSPSHPTAQTRSIVGDSTRGDNTIVMVTSILVNLTTLNISRSFPLSSMIFTSNATADLNGTMITCSGQDFGSGAMASASVQIILIGNNHGAVNITPNVNISQSFEVNGATVALEWDAKNGVSYIVSVQPEVLVDYTQTNSAQLSLSYGREYNISVTASLCGRNRSTSSVRRYVRCPNPAAVISNGNIIISNYGDPIEGTIITLSCLHGLILIGSNTSACMGNGNWEPDLKGIQCNADCSPPIANTNVSLNYSSTLEDSLLTFQCRDGLFPDNIFIARCYRNGSWIPNPSGHACATSSAVNCGEPSPPSDGYIEPYTSTTEGARVYIVHMCQNGQLAFEIIICSSDEEWESVSGGVCLAFVTHESTVKLIASISGSLGSLLAVALLVCGILMTVIVVLTKKIGKTVSSSGGQNSGQSKSQNSEYEEVMASRNEGGHEALEMMQNVAYGQVNLHNNF